MFEPQPLAPRANSYRSADGLDRHSPIPAGTACWFSLRFKIGNSACIVKNLS
jgi:hypothetical protein